MANLWTVLVAVVVVVGIVVAINAVIVPLEIVRDTVGIATGVIDQIGDFTSAVGSGISAAYCTLDLILFVGFLPGCPATPGLIF